MAVEPRLSEREVAGLMEIPHPTKGPGEAVHGSAKVFEDHRARPGEAYLGIVHGPAAAAFAVTLARRAQQKGFEAALYFTGAGALSCLATRCSRVLGGTAGRLAPAEDDGLEAFADAGGKVFACRLGLAQHGAREEDLMLGVIPCHPFDLQDALIEYGRRGAVIDAHCGG